MVGAWIVSGTSLKDFTYSRSAASFEDTIPASAKMRRRSLDGRSSSCCQVPSVQASSQRFMTPHQGTEECGGLYSTAQPGTNLVCIRRGTHSLLLLLPPFLAYPFRNPFLLSSATTLSHTHQPSALDRISEPSCTSSAFCLSCSLLSQLLQSYRPRQIGTRLPSA